MLNQQWQELKKKSKQHIQTRKKEAKPIYSKCDRIPE
jgi:hypothetical protein